MKVDSSGTLAILDGNEFRPTCVGSGAPATAFRIHLVSPPGKLIRTIDLPPPLDHGIGGFDFEGQRLLFDHMPPRYSEPPRSTDLYEMDLTTLDCRKVQLPEGESVYFGRDNARLLDGGKTLKAFDSRDGSIATYHLVPR